MSVAFRLQGVLPNGDIVELPLVKALQGKPGIPIRPADFLIEVALGNIEGYSLEHKFGRNAALPNGSFEPIGLLSVARAFLQAPTTVRVKAGGNAADDVGGDGAQGIVIDGIDSDLNRVQREIATAGAGAGPVSVTQFWRPFRAWVSSVGTYDAANTAAVTIENGAGTQDLLSIGIEFGQTQTASFSIPTGHTGYLLSVDITVDSNQATDITMCTREDFNVVASPMKSVRIQRYWDGVLKNIPAYRPKAPSNILKPLSDIWFEGMGSGGASEATVDFEVLVVQDGF